MFTDVDDLEKAIMDELWAYSEEVTAQLKTDVNQVAKECVRDIKNNAPKLSGDYKKSWKLKTIYESKDDIRIVIHSPKHYRLTHLLEHGHAKVGGGRVEGKPHIGPAEQKAEEKLIKKVKVSISGGNS